MKHAVGYDPAEHFTTTDDDPNSTGRVAARAFIGSLAMGTSIERRTTFEIPEEEPISESEAPTEEISTLETLQPDAKAYLNALRAAYQEIKEGFYENGGKQITLMFNGHEIGHFVDDVEQFVQNPADQRLIIDLDTRTLAAIEEFQAKSFSRERASTARNYFDTSLADKRRFR